MDVRLVRLSVRTADSRIDIVLPERCTFAEVLESILELCPQSLRDNAVGYGGWVLRTASGRLPDGDSTLAAAGVLDGATLFLAGLDPGASVAVYDDIADAVAESVLRDPTRWSTGARRAVTLGAAGLAAALALLALLLSGPPWAPIAMLLATGTAAAQLGAGLLSRIAGDRVAAVVAGLISVVTGAAAAIVATAGRGDLADIGTPDLLLGATAAVVCAITAAVVIGGGTVPLGAVIIGGLLAAVSLGCGVLCDLPLSGCAAVALGLSMGGMPMVPALALRWAAVELPPVPTTLEEVHADSATVRAADVGPLTRRAVDGVTAMIQGLALASLAAATVLAFSDDPTAQALAGVVAAGLMLRARLFITVGQRLPLLLAGMGSIAALALAAMIAPLGGLGSRWIAAPASLAAAVCLSLATRPARRRPSLGRTAEIADLLLAVAVLPLVVGVLGLFGFVRGLAG